MRKKVWLMPALALLASLALFACGGGDDNGGGSADETAITDQIQLASTSADPAKCTQAQTQNFNEQNERASGKDALAQCQQTAGDNVADSADVSNVAIDGESATADVALTGGNADGQTLKLGLVKDGGTWKLDSFDSFVEFDRDAFLRSIDDSLQGVPAETAGCITKQLEAASDEDLQNAILDPPSFQRLLDPCA